MTFKAPPEMQQLGKSVELKLCELVTRLLKQRGSAIVVRPGSDNPRDNGRWGDILLCPSESEAPLMGLEAKGATYPYSVSFSSFEKNFSQTTFFVVDGTQGIWCCLTSDVFDCAERKNEDYFTAEPRLNQRISFSDMLDRIQLHFGEKPV